MTKKGIIEAITSAANNIQTLRDKGLHEATVSAHISNAFNQILGDLVIKGFKNLSLFQRLCIGDGSGIDVQLNEHTGIYYSILPYDISPLPDVRSGVRLIEPMGDIETEFYPIDRGMVSIRQGMLAAGATSTMYYVIGQDNTGQITVDYIGMTSDNALAKVKMYLILPFDAYDEDDTVNIPADQYKILFDMVLNVLQGKNIKDTVNIIRNGQ
jgi:hypothetical protein